MPVNVDPTQLLLGRGKLYFDRFDSAGNSTGLRFVGEADKLEINPTVATKDYFTMSKATRTKIAQNIDTQTHEIDIQLREFQKENIALAFLGDSAALTAVAGNVAGEQLTAKALPGMCYQTAKRNISAVAPAAAGGLGVLDVDFEVIDPELGLIHVLPTTQIFDGTKALTLDYSNGAVNTYQVKGGTESMIQGKLVYIGDPSAGPGFDAEVWRVRIQPSGAVALISDDYSPIGLKGEAMDDSANHPDDPLYHITYR